MVHIYLKWVEVTQPLLKAVCHLEKKSLTREGWAQASLMAAP